MDIAACTGWATLWSQHLYWQHAVACMRQHGTMHGTSSASESFETELILRLRCHRHRHHE